MKADFEFLDMDMKTISQDILESLKSKARSSTKKVFRYNLHREFSDPLQEMLICSLDDSERIHIHRSKAEVIQIIEGEMKISFYDEKKNILSIENIKANTETSFIRIPQGVWHSTVNISKITIYHELASGPFTPEGTEYYE